MPDPSSHPPLRVIVYGGDLAALETTLALRERAGERCHVLLVSPVRDLPIRTHAAGASPGEGQAARFDLGAFAAEHDLGFRSDAVVAVDPVAREARTITGARLRYDALVVAFGARPRGAIPGATTCWGPSDAGALATLIEDLRASGERRVVVAVAAGDRWALPTYELALTAARRAREEFGEASFTVVTPEAAPAELLGPAASELVARRLAEAGIELVLGHEPTSFEAGRLALRPERAIEADRVLAMATVDGPRIGGLPRDEDGFLRVDHFGRVDGAPGIWAAGEVTSYPIRQPGLGAQQAQVVAASIAAYAGAEVEPEPFRPVLRGRLRGSAEASVNGFNGDVTSAPAMLWWPPEQLAGEHLLAHFESKLAVRAPEGDDTLAVSVELDADGRSVASGIA